MDTNISLKDYQQAYRDIIKKEEKRSCLIHVIIYTVVNAGLITLNLMVSPEYIWFYWSILGWGTGLLMHYMFGVVFLNKALTKKEILAEKLVLDRLTKK